MDPSAWPIKTYLLIFTFAGACALSMVYPIVGIANYMMVYMVNPHWWWWGKPLAPFGIRYSMTAALCLFAGMMVSSARVPRSRAIFGDWLILLILFTFIITTSGLLGEGASNYSVVLIDKTIKMAIFLYCLVRMGGERRNFRVILWTLVFGTLMIGNDAYNANADQFLNGRLNSIGGVDFRESSGLGAHMVAMLPLLGIVLLTAKSWWKKPIVVVAAVLAVNTIIQCRTRSAFVGLIAAGIVGVLLAPRGVRLRIYGTLIVAGFGAYSLTDSYFWERMNTVLKPKDYGQDATIQTRVELWQTAWQMFSDHPMGVGVGQFKYQAEQYETSDMKHAFGLPRRVTHNTYLLCATELGIQGLIVFIAIITLSLFKLRRCLRLSRESDDPFEARLMAYGCLLSLVSYLTAAAFTDRLYTESFWWILTLPVCLERALAREVCAVDTVSELDVEPALADGWELEVPADVWGRPMGAFS
ncbi:MAG: O-antigen ligase family protein [Phycisphaerales bacterium]|nr:O-antigen ligase family protein [Phycisphaerales bacterium]